MGGHTRVNEAAAIADACALARQFKAGALSPTQALDIYLNRIEALNPRINAFLALDVARAVAEARASDQRWAAGRPASKLDGVPVGIKANIAVAGLPWHGGIAAYAGRVADVDATCVSQLHRSGLVILGTLNMHEAALGATSDNAAFGRCHNPYRHDFTPGGSSGGSAAAVAARLCAVALGTDTMGSVRIPASYCGVFGYKPVHGAVPAGGIMPLSPTLDEVGILARSAGDVAAMTEILAATSADSYAVAEPRGIRLGVLDIANFGRLEPAVADVFAAVANIAASRAMRLERIELPGWDAVVIRRAALLVVEVEAMSVHREMLLQNPAGFSPQLTQMLHWADRQPAANIAAAYDILRDAGQMLRAEFAGYDAVLTPTTASTAFGFHGPVPVDQADFTLLGNIAGLAAVAFPLGVSASGLPLSAQIMSFDAGLAIAIAGLLATLP